ncbi:Hypothetical predicted protein [Cloeon dipterum]|uniref:Uncharacterized protein n=2 Tax=Cloeon dipterum TaxID=197152 RepID=A0A8S1CSQ3_9INSE|nr:Hypothetical predicted protein [Cloeon dipterum]
MHSPLALLLLLVLTASTGAAPSKKSSDEYMVAPARDVVLWNQSQDGKINLQVSLKDVQIVALLNSDNSYDEDSSDYDYSELEALINSTIAATSTTAKPTDSEEVTSSSDDEPLLQLSDVLQIASEQEEKQKDSNNTTTLPLAFHSNGKPENITQLTPETKGATSIYHREAPKRSAVKTPCAEGEVRDRIGRCRQKSSKPKRRRPTARLAYPLKLSLQSLARGFRLARLSQDDDWES